MHKLTKKVLGIVLAGTLSIAMGITAFATPSPEKNAIVTEYTEYTEAVDKNGNNVEIIIENLTEEGKEAAKLLQDKQTLKEIIGDNYVDGMEVIDVREVRAIGNPVFPVTITFKVPGVLASTNVAILHYENGAWTEEMEVIDVREVRAIGNPVFPVTITFKVPGVLASTNVAILHYENGAWTEEPSKAGKGTITATFDSLSPVAFVVDKNTSASSTESPKTSETPTVAVALVVGIVALASAVMLKKKTALK